MITNWVRAIAAGSLLSLQAGCAIVRIEAGSLDEVQVKAAMGVVSVEIKPQVGAVVVDATSFGAIRGAEGLTLGYQAATYAALAQDRCQLVVWVTGSEDLTKWSEVLGDASQVCIVRAARPKREKRS